MTLQRMSEKEGWFPVGKLRTMHGGVKSDWTLEEFKMKLAYHLIHPALGSTRFHPTFLNLSKPIYLLFFFVDNNKGERERTR